MKTLPPIRPTPEQLPLISENRLGIEVIRGAAGSGKTSTAILRLRSLCYMFEERRQREGDPRPVRILVLTFNRTLSGYVRALAEEQVAGRLNADMTIETFGRWAMAHLGWPRVADDGPREATLRRLAAGLPLSREYVCKEVEYLLGRFEPERLVDYVSAERTGRGNLPQVGRPLRQRILDEVVTPYRAWLAAGRGDGVSLLDWNDVAVRMARAEQGLDYDIVIVDESQDFSANQLRAIRRHMAADHAVTFVIDTVQRIYARGFTWQETGFDMRGARYHTLRENHRNTVETARFAAGILTGMAVEADGALPDLTAAQRHGAAPLVLRGLYSQQISWAIEFICRRVDLRDETVAFLKPLGGRFFNYLKGRLVSTALHFVEITREAEWSYGPENIALSTFHSAKGLEFDHVFILGLNNENTTHGDAAVDDQLTVLRRLLAVAVARARQTVVVGYKPGEESRLVQFFEPSTFDEINL